MFMLLLFTPGLFFNSPLSSIVRGGECADTLPYEFLLVSGGGRATSKTEEVVVKSGACERCRAVGRCGLTSTVVVTSGVEIRIRGLCGGFITGGSRGVGGGAVGGRWQVHGEHGGGGERCWRRGRESSTEEEKSGGKEGATCGKTSGEEHSRGKRNLCQFEEDPRSHAVIVR
jgi:hypothetical protein